MLTRFIQSLLITEPEINVGDLDILMILFYFILLIFYLSFPSGGDAAVCQKDCGSYAGGNVVFLARWSNHHVAGCKRLPLVCFNMLCLFYGLVLCGGMAHLHAI